MSAMTQQKQVTILLGVIVALLVAIIAVLVFQANAVPEPTVDGSQTTQPAATAMGTQPAPAAASFDPATAPQVPAEQTPQDYVTQYYQMCQDGDYAAAFPLLPAATQVNSYGDAASFQAQLEGYGITGYSVADQIENGDTIQVTGTQDTPQMPISYTWTFVKGENGAWLVADRQMGGM